MAKAHYSERIAFVGSKQSGLRFDLEVWREGTRSLSDVGPNGLTFKILNYEEAFVASTSVPAIETFATIHRLGDAGRTFGVSFPSASGWWLVDPELKRKFLRLLLAAIDGEPPLAAAFPWPDVTFRTTDPDLIAIVKPLAVSAKVKPLPDSDAPPQIVSLDWRRLNDPQPHGPRIGVVQ